MKILFRATTILGYIKNFLYFCIVKQHLKDTMGKTIISDIPNWIKAIVSILTLLVALGIIKKCEPNESLNPKQTIGNIKDSSDNTIKPKVKPESLKTSKKQNRTERGTKKVEPNIATLVESKEDIVIKNLEKNKKKYSFIMVLNSDQISAKKIINGKPAKIISGHNTTNQIVEIDKLNEEYIIQSIGKDFHCNDSKFISINRQKVYICD